jgi:hypothetical protein
MRRLTWRACAVLPTARTLAKQNGKRPKPQHCQGLLLLMQGHDLFG